MGQWLDSSDQQRFNPRVREGRDSNQPNFTRNKYVSIHASVKDATSDNSLIATNPSFNPRVREGRDLNKT